FQYFLKKLPQKQESHRYKKHVTYLKNEKAVQPPKIILSKVQNLRKLNENTNHQAKPSIIAQHTS
ncbi:hypothetical protein, partial [Candidatus Ichthyocystis hellenicum]|uniref:hypothetical protein n=1 Tax=Candidatus Ichthyocystis hellenicum TaxID=1561003 RepID=UPI001F5EB0A3